MKLSGKHALITGGNGVIGAAIARALADEGAEILVSGRSGGDIAADVSKESDVRALMRAAQEKFDVLDVLVCAAGTNGAIGLLEETEPGAWMEAVNVNLLGTMQCIRYALPLLRKSARGKIVTFAGGGEGPRQRLSSYVASKAGVVRLTETLAAELAPIEINVISPGLVNSGLVQRILKLGEAIVGKEMFGSAQKEVAGEGGAVSPDKAAALAVFLASDASNGLSGRNISAQWDTWEQIPEHLKEIMSSDVYTVRRIKPKDRGYGWK